VVTFFREGVGDILNLIPPHKRLILDCREDGLAGNYRMVYQDVVKDVSEALSKVHKQLQKYSRLLLVGESSHSQIEQVERGVQTYCLDYNMSYRTISEVTPAELQKNTVYLIVSDSEQILANTVKQARQNNYKVGEDIGLICYDDSPMKEVLEGGITTINTDFVQMGHTAADLIINRKSRVVANPSQLILRNSL
jgi:DNA-binding LacI/PurR family transcriptional regulator